MLKSGANVVSCLQVALGKSPGKLFWKVSKRGRITLLIFWIYSCSAPWACRVINYESAKYVLSVCHKIHFCWSSEWVKGWSPLSGLHSSKCVKLILQEISLSTQTMFYCILFYLFLFKCWSSLLECGCIVNLNINTEFWHWNCLVLSFPVFLADFIVVWSVDVT